MYMLYVYLQLQLPIYYMNFELYSVTSNCTGGVLDITHTTYYTCTCTMNTLKLLGDLYNGVTVSNRCVFHQCARTIYYRVLQINTFTVPVMVNVPPLSHDATHELIR